MATPPLHQRGDLLDLIARALQTGTDQERRDLLAAAAERISVMNGEYDTICTERGKAREDLVKMTEAYTNMRDFAQSQGLDTAARNTPL